MKVSKKLDNAHQKSWFLSTLDRHIDTHAESSLFIEVKEDSRQHVICRQKFHDIVTKFAIFLTGLGVQRGSRLILDIDVGMRWEVFGVWCACQLLGACAIFFPPDMRYRDVKTEIDDADAHNNGPSIAIVGTPERAKKWVTTEADASIPRQIIYFNTVCRNGDAITTLFEGSVPAQLTSFEVACAQQAEGVLQPTFVHDDAPTAFVFTQGSHQNARRVELSYAHLRAQAEDLQRALSLSVEDRLAIDLTSPLSVCLFGFAASLFSGATLVCRAADMSMSTLLSTAGITHAFMLPQTMAGFVHQLQMPDTDSALQSHWRHICLLGGKFRVRNSRKYLKWTEKLIDSICTHPIKDAAMPALKALISYGNHFNAKHGEFFSFLSVPVYNAFTVSELGFVHLHPFMGEGGYLRSVETKVRNGVLSVKSRRSSKEICTDDFIFEDARCGLCSQRSFMITLADSVSVDVSSIREILRRHAIIDEVFVFGHDRPFLTALIYLDPAALQSWCVTQKLSTDSFEQMAQHPQVYSHIRQFIESCNQRRSPQESIQKFAILTRPIALDPRILTPCFLTRPTDVERRYHTLIQSLYSDNF